MVCVRQSVWVHHWRARRPRGPAFSIDAGQPATFENWIDAGGSLARVRYRGASWDALIEPTAGAEPAPGTTLYVISTQGNTLKVSARRPS